MKTHVHVQIDAPIEQVWAEAVDFGSHHEWMDDALSIDFATSQTTGVGTVLLVKTRLGPLRTLDRFTITDVVEHQLVRGVHDGAVTGTAEWRLAEIDGSTSLAWHESLRFPWFFGGRLGEIVAKPLFVWMWRRNLERLKKRVEAQ